MVRRGTSMKHTEYRTPVRRSRKADVQCMTDSVKVLHPTRHKTGHFRDVPQANILAWYAKTKPNTTKARIRQSEQMYYDTK